MILVHFFGKPFNITVIQVYAPMTDAEEVEVEQFYGSSRISRTSRTRSFRINTNTQKISFSS